MEAASDQGPYHLAQAVFRALTVSASKPPEEWLLGVFFEALYQVSFRGEGQPQIRRVVWQESLGDQAGNQAEAESVFLRLRPPVPLHSGSLAALLAAAGTYSALLVSAGPISKGEGPPLVILGMAPRCAEAGQSGLFGVEIIGPAHLKVDVGLDYPLELRRNRLSLSALNVFGGGPVRERLSALLRPVFPAVRALLPAGIAASPLLSGGAIPLPGGAVLISEQDWPYTVEQFWIKALASLLERVSQTRASGLVALASHSGSGQTEQWPAQEWAAPPHQAAYSQVRHLLEERAAEAIRQQVESVKLLSERLTAAQIPLDDLSLQEPPSRLRPPGSDPEISRALQTLASLTRAEGILRLDPHLNLVSFGGQPGGDMLPERVYLAEDVLGSELTPISLRSFGPRNQALLHFCYQDPEALGFAVTQEGEVRAMLRHEDKLIVWNTVSVPH